MSFDAVSMVYGGLSVIISMSCSVQFAHSMLGSTMSRLVSVVGIRSAMIVEPEPPGSSMPVRFSVGYPTGWPAGSPGGMRNVSLVGLNEMRNHPGCGMYMFQVRWRVEPGRNVCTLARALPVAPQWRCFRSMSVRGVGDVILTWAAAVPVRAATVTAASSRRRIGAFHQQTGSRRQHQSQAARDIS